MGLRTLGDSATGLGYPENNMTLRPCDPAGPMVNGTSVAGRNDLWSSWQDPLGESQCRHLESWNKDPSIIHR